MPVEDYPYYGRYLKQGHRCTVCTDEIMLDEYCAVNTPEGVQVIHKSCLGNIRVNGCHAQIEVLYKSAK